MAYKSVVKKDRINTIIRTPKEKIEGYVFLLPNTRLLDLLNSTKDFFIPVSEAQVFDESTGKLLYASDFVAVNKNHVIVITEQGTNNRE